MTIVDGIDRVEVTAQIPISCVKPLIPVSDVPIFRGFNSQVQQMGWHIQLIRLLPIRDKTSGDNHSKNNLILRQVIRLNSL